jgi:hypothetical protein
MKNTNIYTYIYYNKRYLFWFALGSVIFVMMFIWIAYDEMTHERLYIQVGYKKYITVSESYVPFEWPYSLVRIPLFAWIGLLISGFGAWFSVGGLFFKGPLYIITPEGIMDCKRGFVPWSEVQEIITRDIKGSKSITIRLCDPKRHFGSNWRSFFGYRGFGFVPGLMRDEEVEQLDDIGPKELTED